MATKTTSEDQPVDRKAPNQKSGESIFDGGSFAISHLSASPEGFDFQTAQSIGRRAPGSVYPLDDEQKGRLKSAMQREMKK
jgi:hypothetical protein